MKNLIDKINKWLKRNKTGGSPEPERSFTKREKHWFMQKNSQLQKTRVDRLRGDTCPYVCPQTGLN